MMPNTIYATFATEHDAERAAGALMDHGVDAEDISFVLPEHLSPISASDTAGVPRSHSVEAAPPPAVPLGDVDPRVNINIPPPPPVPPIPVPRSATPQELETGMPARYHYDALGAVIPDDPPAATTAVLPASPTKTALPADAPSDVVEHEKRAQAHIVDMNRQMPSAATGISTTTAGDAAKGALEGAGIGVGLGILLGLATVAIPGIGWVAGAGALVAGLAAATGAAGGIAGGVFGYLTDLGIPPDTAQMLSEKLKAGQIILSVHQEGEIPTDEILTLIRKYHATSVQAF